MSKSHCLFFSLTHDIFDETKFFLMYHGKMREHDILEMDIDTRNKYIEYIIKQNKAITDV